MTSMPDLTSKTCECQNFRSADGRVSYSLGVIMYSMPMSLASGPGPSYKMHCRTSAGWLTTAQGMPARLPTRGEMGAVVICLHVPAGLVGIGVEGVQVGADLPDRLEVLDEPGTGF